MAIFRKIHVQFWSDVFIQSLTPEQKFFFLYLLTNERTKQCGIYEITKRQISYDTGYNVETVEKLINFFQDCKKIKFSFNTNEIAIKNWDKYNSSRSPDVQNLVNKEVKSIKDKKLIEWIQSDDTVLPQSKKSLREEPEEEPEPEREKESELEGEKKQVANIGSDVVKACANEAWKDQIWKENLCMGLSIKMDELKRWLAMFNSSVSNDDIKNFNTPTYKKMARGWIVSQKNKGTVITMDKQKDSNSAPLKLIS